MNRFTTVSIMIVLVLLATYLKVGSGVYIRFGRSLKTRRTTSSARKSEVYTKRETPNFANKWMAPARSIRTYRDDASNEPYDELDFSMEREK